MSTFKVFQILLTNEQRDAVNAGEYVPAFNIRNQLSMDFEGKNTSEIASKAFNENVYTHVSNIEATDLNNCFEVGNIGPESKIERFERMHSLSVGDVLVAEDGSINAIASIGFVTIVRA